MTTVHLDDGRKIKTDLTVVERDDGWYVVNGSNLVVHGPCTTPIEAAEWIRETAQRT